MNALCYKVIFSKRLGALVAVGENATSQGKSASGAGSRSVEVPLPQATDAGNYFVGSLKVLFTSSVLACMVANTGFAAPATNALPTQGVVQTGAATISTNGAAMTINQATQKASINWNSFNIGSQASVNVVQNNASSVLLNRVVGNDPSQIFGKLTANGQVILINPNGVVFGKGGRVTASAFTASTFGMTDANFQNGKYKYERNGSTAGVTVEQGASIQTIVPGGYVALLGANVNNQGEIHTQQGAVVMAAGEGATLPSALTDSVGVPLSSKVRLELAPSTINASVENGGVITTEGGQVLMQAAAVVDAVSQVANASVSNTGTIDTTGAQGGAVTLLAEAGTVQARGTIKTNSTVDSNKGGDIIIGRDEDTGALAASTDVSGATLESNKGFVETSGEYLATTGIRVRAKEWLLDPNDIVIGSTATTGSSLTTAQAANGVSQILASDVSAALTAGTNVIIATSASATGGNGDITVNSAISNTAAGNTLTLNAGRNVVINDNIKVSNLSLNAATGSVSGNANVNITVSGLTTINSATDGTFAGKISGTGALIKKGLGTTTLSGSNTYSGGTTIDAGAIASANSSNNLGSTGTVTINANGTLALSTSGNPLSANQPVLANNLTGSGKITYSGSSGNQMFLKGNMSGFNGTVTINGTGATLWFNNTGSQGANFIVNSGNMMGLWSQASGFNNNGGDNGGSINAPTSRTFNAGNLTGGGTIYSDGNNKTVTLSVGALDQAGTFSGVITNTYPNGGNVKINLEKVGTGTQVLTGNNTYTGTTTVNGGTLQIGNNGTSGTLGTGDVTLNNGSNLWFKRGAATNISNRITAGDATGGNLRADISSGGLTINASQISVLGNIVLSTQGGAISIAPSSGTSSISGNNITVDNRGSTIANDGSITTAGSMTSPGTGVRLNNSTLTGRNNVSILGSSSNANGVELLYSRIKTETGKAIVSGTAATTGVGIYVDVGSTTNTTFDAGTKGSMEVSGTSKDGNGMYLYTKYINTTGDVTLSGKSTSKEGLYSRAHITAADNSKLTITGVSDSNKGVSLNYVGIDSNAVVGGNGTNIFINGSSNSAEGVYVNSVVQSNNGDINIKATSGGFTNEMHRSITAVGGNVSITADTMSINAPIKAVDSSGKGTGTVNLTTATADRAIKLGAADTAAAGGNIGLTNAELNFITATKTIIGSTTAGSAAGDISVDAAITTNSTSGNLELKTAGNVTINNALTVGASGAKNLTITATGASSAVSGTAVITANQLAITANTVALNTAANQVNSLAASTTGSFAFKNGKAITLTTVDGITGLTTSGGATVETTTGNLTIKENVSNSGTGDVVLGAGTDAAANEALDSNIKVSDKAAGGKPSVSNAGGGKTFLYTGSTGDTDKLGDLNSTFATLDLSAIGNDKQNAASYTTFKTGNTRNTITDGADAQVMFREKIAIGSLTGVELVKTYGDTTTKDTAQVALLNEVKTALKAVTANSGNSEVTNKSAGKIRITNAALIDSLSGSLTTQTTDFSTSKFLKANENTAYRYGALTSNKYESSIAADQVTVKVKKLALVGTIDQSTSIYGDALVAGAIHLNNKVGTDIVNADAVTFTTTGLASTSGNLKAGTHANVQSVTGLTGNDKDNYTFANVKGDYKVTPKSLAATYLAKDKVFDGSTVAEVTGTVAPIAGDKVNVLHTSANFDSADIGTAKTVTVSGISLSGADATNYKVDTTTNAGNKATTKANITAVAPKPPTPVVTPTDSTRVKVPVGSANPFQLASAEDLADEVCSANSLENCYCEESPLTPNVDICYEPKTSGKGPAR